MTQQLLDTLKMFGFLFTELSLLFLAISYLVVVLQYYIPPERIQRTLSSQNGRGYIVAAFLGAITPFCSCSTIPFLKGLIRAKASFGTMMVFLFASPLLNPIIIVLFAAVFGFGITAWYFTSAMVISIAAGYILEKLGFERYVRPQAKSDSAKSCCAAKPAPSQEGTQTSCGDQAQSCATPAKPSMKQSKFWGFWLQSWSDYKAVLPYLLLGITIGAVIYGYLPADIIAQYASSSNPLAIPVAAVIGIPLYIRAEAVIPISAALLGKGMGLGAVMALIIGSAGASLTEVILLKSIFKSKLIYAFVAVILFMAIASGYLLDAFMALA
ncbi:permease [Polycladidibacter stylochi]|uniref:permease n=1 Tax=Polycladidibacter stylochi TaxID=1807766 RepID=UPI000834D73C|nr:permease [Pseudovibrio stylochi]